MADLHNIDDILTERSAYIRTRWRHQLPPEHQAKVPDKVDLHVGYNREGEVVGISNDRTFVTSRLRHEGFIVLTVH